MFFFITPIKIGTNGRIQQKMIRNMLIEFFGGLLPVFGDAFDAIYKANTEILRNYLCHQLGEQPKWKFPWFTFIWISTLILIVFMLFLLIF